MRFSLQELDRMLKRAKHSKEDEVKFNILNFIHTIHLNRLSFIEESFKTDYYIDPFMTFRKKAGQVVGIVTAIIDCKEHRYVFTEHRFEEVNELSEQS